MQTTAPQSVALDTGTFSQARALQAKPPLALILLVVCAAIAVYLDRPPRSLSKDAPVSVFSADRAASYLAVIARAPHPINSAEHAAVRDYIVSTLQGLGFTPEIQRTTDINLSRHVPGALDNIICRLKGSGTGKAVLLAGHYDSVPAGPGADDDGVAVASLLETARILRSLPQLKRDVIFLFTDGEERGLLGARAFVSEHPWAHDVGVVLNFEARGTTGPSIMFETSDNNGWLIKNFSQAAIHPVANSLSYEIYKLLPGDTDFTIFRRAGYSGLNFAYIQGFAYYHTSLDTPQNADRGSIQQHGDYMLNLARQFGNADTDDPRSSNLVYFDIFGQFLVRYGKTVAKLFLAFAIVIVASALYFGIRAKRLRAGAILGGVASAIIGIAVTILASKTIAWLVLAGRGHSSRLKEGLTYETGWYILSFCVIGLGCSMAFYFLAAKRFGAEGLAAGSFLVWMVLIIAMSIYLPGGTYLLLWPLLFSALAWLVLFVRGGTSANATNAILFLGSLPAIVIMVPMIHKIYSAFVDGSTLFVSALLGLLLSLLIGPIAMETASRRWLLSLAFVAGGLGLLLTAIAISGVA